MSKKLLIADDTSYMRALIRETLQSAGFIILAEAHDGLSVVDLYKQHHPDLLILNVVMPGQNGIETLKLIKAWDPAAKILLCSAMGQASTVISAIREGANDFLIKPFEPKALIDTVNRILSPKGTLSSGS
jgi:two-component system, chemotaxis family, chemotaxis protein CheY